jgi:hypothetical protein
MHYRDEHAALQHRVDNLEQELAEAEKRLSEQADRGDRAARLTRLERQVESASRILTALRAELVDLRRAESEAGHGESVAGPVRAAPSRARRAPLLIAASILGAAALGMALLRTRTAPAPATTAALPTAALPSTPARAEGAKVDDDLVPGILYPLLARDPAGALVDPVVWGRSGGMSCLARFDGRAGRRAWRVCPYGPPSGGAWADDQNLSALVDDTILVALSRGLDAFDARTGAKRWSAHFDEGIVGYCRTADGAVYLSHDRGAGDAALDLSTGAARRAQRPSSCLPVPTNGGSPWVAWGEGVAGTASGLQAEGMVATGGVWHRGRNILLGYARPGPHVPVAASVDAHHAILWRRLLPPPEIGAVDADAPKLAVLDDRRFCAVYPASPDLSRVRFGCWDPATGAPSWDLPLAEPPQAILLAGEYLIVRSSRGVSTAWAFHDVASGALRLSL